MKSFWQWLVSLFSKPVAPVVPIQVNPVSLQPTKTVLNGIDVSHWDTIDWTKLKPLPDFISAKATDGANNVDPTFKIHRSRAKALGIPFQAYHFSEPGDGLAQAKHFCEVVGALEVGDLAPCLDWERSVSGIMDEENAKIWLEYVEKTLGIAPFIYCAYSDINDMNLSTWFRGSPLWFAHPEKGAATPPRPWTSYVFLQNYFGEKGSPTGFDQDVFYGDINALNQWRKK